MTKSWFIGTAALVLLASSAYAADDKAAPPAPHEEMEHGGPGEHHHGDWVPYEQYTLEEARKHAHEKADKLDKMTQAEWDAHKKEVLARKAEHKAKWDAMTPEEKQKQKDAWKSKHALDHAEKTGAAPAPDTKPVEK